MKISLSLKKRLLSTVVGIILAGNILRLTTPTDLVVIDSLAEPIPAYASSDLLIEDLEIPQYDFAYEQTNFQSIQTKMDNMDVDMEKVRKIEAYLARRGAPLASEARTFVIMADKYDLPYNLMPAISVIESGGGKHNYRPYNYAGMGGQSRAITFANYEQAIERHAQIIRNGYFNKGARTPEDMEKYYCLNCPTWGEKVQGVMNGIDSM